MQRIKKVQCGYWKLFNRQTFDEINQANKEGINKKSKECKMT